MQTTTAVSFRHTSQDATCQGNCTRFATERQKSMDRGSDAVPRYRRPLPFPLTCQHRRNISRSVEVYGLRKRHGSMMQTTTTVSAGMPEKIQKSMNWGSDATPRCRRPLLFPLACQHEWNISRKAEVYGSREKRSSMMLTTTVVSVWHARQDATCRDNRTRFPGWRSEVYGSGQRRNSTMQTTTAVSADIQ